MAIGAVGENGQHWHIIDVTASQCKCAGARRPITGLSTQCYQPDGIAALTMDSSMLALHDHQVLAWALVGLGLAGGAVGYLTGLLLEHDQRRSGFNRPATRTMLGSSIALAVALLALAAITSG